MEDLERDIRDHIADRDAEENIERGMKFAGRRPDHQHCASLAT